MTIVENIQVKTLHSNHATLSDYYVPGSTPPAGGPTDPKLPTNPLPETQTETPAPVPIIVTNPEKVVEYVYVETPSAGAAIDNQDGTITVYI